MEPATPQNALSEFLRQYREDNGLTVQDLAQRCQIPMAKVIGLEYGDRPMDEDLEALARGLDMTLSTVRRASLGEPVPGSRAELASKADRPATLGEAIQDLTPSQIEKTKDFIQFLRWSDRRPSQD